MIHQRSLFTRLASAILACCFLTPILAAQDGIKSKKMSKVPELANDKGIRLGPSQTFRWQVGVSLTGGNSRTAAVFTTIPVPNNWPEQTVEMVEEDFSSSVKGGYFREIDGRVKQLVATVPGMRPGQKIKALVTFEVKVHSVIGPEDPSIFSIPRRVPREVKMSLGGSEGIEFRNSKLRRFVKELTEKHQTDWEQVQAIYDWVRNNINLNRGEINGALSAFRTGEGCPEDAVSLFVAMCRAHKVPARFVWVEGHQYAEFYLVDDEKKGHWFPAQIVGNRDFGSMSTPMIILQRGDNIKVPEKKERQKYVAEFLMGKTKGKRPKVKFHRDLLPAVQ